MGRLILPRTKGKVPKVSKEIQDLLANPITNTLFFIIAGHPFAGSRRDYVFIPGKSPKRLIASPSFKI
jgi:hypothetical protein